jgi:S-adenosyl-L-methionine hydrolase (adenosine-forming)
MSAITLTTDFGTSDWFVGTMKGVILALAPSAAVVDLTHDVPQGDVRAGAFALAAGCSFFKPGTVHVAVIDPGVGGPRKILVVETARYRFVAPDNGVLTLALAREKIKRVHALENPALRLPKVSRTFHGRDIFAPAAAHLSRGYPVSKTGPRLPDYERLPWPEPVRSPGVIRGEIVYVDRFGNAISNIPSAWLPRPGPAVFVYAGSRNLAPWAGHYQAVPPGQPVAVPGSSGCLELAVNGGHAARRLKLSVGSRVRVRAAGA